MKNLQLILLLILGITGSAQSKVDQDTLELYKNYREDQFFMSITYNVLNFKSPEIAQNGFSPGFHFGFIRDMPINARRNLAIGLGIGLSLNSYNQNLSIFRPNSEINFAVFNSEDRNVTQNRFSTYLVEVPIEFRWRTSTPSTYSFWRIYTGFKLGYMFYNSTQLKSDLGEQKLKNIDVFNRLQYGLTLSAGLNTWNIHLYYGLNTLFNNQSRLNNESIDLATFNIGLVFYIL